MADDNLPVANEGSDDENPNYKPPAEKTLQEIVHTDQEDESLRKYKETLLGSATSDVIIVDANDPRKVIVKKLALIVEGRDEMVLDLSGMYWKMLMPMRSLSSHPLPLIFQVI